MTRYNKAIAAAIAAFAAIAASQGLEIPQEFQDALIIVVTTIAVWVVPNKTA